MTVKGLKLILDKLPDDMDVLVWQINAPAWADAQARVVELMSPSWSPELPDLAQKEEYLLISD